MWITLSVWIYSGKDLHACNSDKNFFQIFGTVHQVTRRVLWFGPSFFPTDNIAPYDTCTMAERQLYLAMHARVRKCSSRSPVVGPSTMQLKPPICPTSCRVRNIPLLKCINQTMYSGSLSSLDSSCLAHRGRVSIMIAMTAVAARPITEPGTSRAAQAA